MAVATAIILLALRNSLAERAVRKAVTFLTIIRQCLCVFVSRLSRAPAAQSSVIDV